MFVAKDENDNLVEAKDASDECQYYCRTCGGELILKNGPDRTVHFAHKRLGDCAPFDSNNMTEWHRRMQEYFPPESREYPFTREDPLEKGKLERRRADVYIEDRGIVIEFQHSSINSVEFEKRTRFHLDEGRRVVWVFNESLKLGDMGKLQKDDSCYDPVSWDSVYENRAFKWKRKRKFLDNISSSLSRITKDENRTDFAIFLYTGEGSEGEDYVHRIIQTDDVFGFDYIVISCQDLLMDNDMDVDGFFRSEEEWIDRSPFSEEIYKERVAKEQIKEENRKEREALERKGREARQRLIRAMNNNMRKGRP